MPFIKTSAVVFLILVFSGGALAAKPQSKCDNPGVLQTEYWKKFENIVKNEYYKNYVGHDGDIRLAAKDRASFLGHALGRLAKAVNNDPERQKIFNCVQLGIYQTMGFVAHFHLPLGITESVSLFDLIKEASIGGLDAQIARASGVTSVEPYDEYLNEITPLRIPIRGTSTTPPVLGSGAIIKEDPADKFGGNTSAPIFSSGTCDNWMTITMVVDMEKSCQGFVDDGYGRRPSTTDCIVCDPDDFHPATVKPPKPENDVTDTLLAEKVCSIANLKSGKEWRFAQNVGYSFYYEHSSHLCSGGSDSVMKIEGKKLLRFSCKKGWQSCARKKSADGDLIYPEEDYKWGKRQFSKLKVKWRGMTPRDLYIEKK